MAVLPVLDSKYVLLPLTYVIGNLNFILEEIRAITGPSPSARLGDLLGVIGEALEGADRIRKIVRGLRALSREDVVVQSVDVGSVVDMALNMAAHEIRHKATITVNARDVPPVLADESGLTQVIVNLVVNAAQAFREADPARNRIALAASAEPAGRVTLTVSDNGPGIPESLQRRIFDPFFTTKPVGQGTGLGLSVSRTIVDALGGELSVASREGMGATFSVVLPVAPEVAQEPGPAPAASGARARILVVDDDVAVLNTVRRILAREHEVVVLSDPREALRMLEGGAVFDLVLCDPIMPYLGGEELHARVAARSPALAERFVFISGGVTSPSVQAFLARVPNERMEKPFVVQNLLGLARRSVRPSSS